MLHSMTQPSKRLSPCKQPHSAFPHKRCCYHTGKPTALSHGQLVDLLLSLSADEAAAEASALMARLNFVSTYAFGKLLTEQLVDDPASLPGVAKAIVRPSLVTTMAGGCCPGYVLEVWACVCRCFP